MCVPKPTQGITNCIATYVWQVKCNDIQGYSYNQNNLAKHAIVQMTHFCA